ncbi:hypothetical protein FNF29_00625 [Cafeteria roenbergensis]|uniref:Chloride channel protein n=2 Tax=Cafeteria roenbergensis TaxID=33653 RepID=A0A5A8CVT8_CAFRO|nr:hypothetical protein FNF29_00625 [Cafeteria roenbergensis]|eukprot:KAA0157273.1 hypothetical protein FNF29_00625 [Cafeteria roenbergensis]
MAALGHHLYGDAAYGCTSAHAPRVCLHAWALALPLHRAGKAGRRGKIVRRLVDAGKSQALLSPEERDIDAESGMDGRQGLHMRAGTHHQADMFDPDYYPTPERSIGPDVSQLATVRLGRDKGGKETSKRLESFDFDPWDSLIWRVHIANILSGREGRCCPRRESGLTRFGGVCGYFKRRACLRWGLNFLTAVITALVAVGITALSRALTKLRFEAVGDLLLAEMDGTVESGMAFAAFLGIGVACATVSATLVSLVEPVAAGSGISEIKCVLNGVKLPRVVRFKTLLVKAVGVGLSVASGLPVGKEGPMIHSGAVVAAGLSQGKSRTFGVSTDFTRVPDFRNDQEKRDFISCGAAAGVAAAFNAPVGGTLFALEEGSSFWSQALTWRAFACAMVSAYTINIFLSGLDGHWGKLSTLGMFSFGDFNSTGQNARPYVIAELIAFVSIGCLGGLAGAVFNFLNERLTRFRMLHVTSPAARITEVVFVTSFMACVAFFVPLFMGKCRLVPDDAVYAEAVVRFYCAKGQYNDMATFFFAPAEEAIRMLFHFETGNPDAPAFGWLGLLVGWVIYAAVTCLTYGVAVPSGLFVPSLLTGAAMGRAVGELINLVLGAGSVDAGTYSLIGAAAMLGGMARMTISLAVILIECTGDLQYGLPLMLTLLAARWTGNVFNEGLYDIHIHLRHWPLLEEKPSKSVASKLRVCDVMVTPVVQLCEVVTVRDALAVLDACSHNGFPVTFSAEAMERFPRFGNLAGIINRKHITSLIANKAFHAERPPTALPNDGTSTDGAGSDDVEGAGLGRSSGARAGAAWSRDDAPSPLSREVHSGTLATSADGAAKAVPSAQPAAARAGSSSRGSRPRSRQRGHGPSRTVGSSQSSLAPWELVRQGAYVPTDQDVKPILAAILSRGGSAAVLPTPGLSGRGGAPHGAAAAGADAEEEKQRRLSQHSMPGRAFRSAAAPAGPARSPLDDPDAAEDHDGAASPPVAIATAIVDRISAAEQRIRRTSSASSLNVGSGALSPRPAGAGHGRLASATSSAAIRPAGVSPQAAGAAMFGLDYEGQPLLPWSAMERGYPRYPTAEEARAGLSEEDLSCWLDLRPYMNATPYTVHARAPLMRGYRLFRSMGLRHLIAVNDAHDVVGILTRRDLLEEHLHNCLERRR